MLVVRLQCGGKVAMKLVGLAAALVAMCGTAKTAATKVLGSDF
jgi:hypothetical protein